MPDSAEEGWTARKRAIHRFLSSQKIKILGLEIIASRCYNNGGVHLQYGRWVVETILLKKNKKWSRLVRKLVHAKCSTSLKTSRGFCVLLWTLGITIYVKTLKRRLVTPGPSSFLLSECVSGLSQWIKFTVVTQHGYSESDIRLYSFYSQPLHKSKVDVTEAICQERTIQWIKDTHQTIRNVAKMLRTQHKGMVVMFTTPDRDTVDVIVSDNIKEVWRFFSFFRFDHEYHRT